MEPLEECPECDGVGATEREISWGKMHLFDCDFCGGVGTVPVQEPIRISSWRDIFIKYVELVGDYEGTSFLYERDWTPEEWERIEGAVW